MNRIDTAAIARRIAAIYKVHPTADGYAVVMHTDEGDQCFIQSFKKYDRALNYRDMMTKREESAAQRAAKQATRKGSGDVHSRHDASSPFISEVGGVSRPTCGAEPAYRADVGRRQETYPTSDSHTCTGILCDAPVDRPGLCPDCREAGEQSWRDEPRSRGNITKDGE